MPQLLLLRHAKSDWADPALSDHARPLNDRGRHAAATMRGAIQSLGLIPELVLVSSALRTRQTLDLLAPWSTPPQIEVLDKLYLATAPQILATLNGVAETVRSVMVIGHNPGMHDLVKTLAGETALLRQPLPLRRMAEHYPTAALAEFSFPGPWWSLDAGNAHLVRFLIPADLPEAAAEEVG